MSPIAAAFLAVVVVDVIVFGAGAIATGALQAGILMATFANLVIVVWPKP